MARVMVVRVALALCLVLLSVHAFAQQQDAEDALDMAFLEADAGVDEDVAGGDVSLDSGDGVDNIIDSLVKDVKTGNMKALGGATATVLANSNVLNHKEANRNSNFEEKLKKTKEEDRKTKREDFKKQRMEEGQKKLEDKAKARVAAQKKKLRQEQIKLEDEQDKKLAAEEKAKANEAHSKKAFEQKTKKTVRAAQKRAQEMESKERKKLAQEQQDEEKKKQAMEKKNKASIQEIKAKAKQKRIQQERSAKAKRKAEKAGKERKLKLEQKQKAAARAQERRQKMREANAAGKAKDCMSQRVYFERNHQWQSCPSGYLANGMYRGGGEYLNSVYYLSCCKPSDDKGSKTLEVSGCQTVNWVSSFDRRGWSYCPKNTYVQGFYKSSCNWIYCLEYAKCCAIAGSRGYKGCGTTSWFQQGRAGWNHVPANHFMRGLYRGDSHNLYSISHSSHCGFYAYP